MIYKIDEESIFHKDIMFLVDRLIINMIFIRNVWIWKTCRVFDPDLAHVYFMS